MRFIFKNIVFAFIMLCGTQHCLSLYIYFANYMGSFFLSGRDYRSIKYSSIIFTRCILPKQNLKVDNEAQNCTVYRKNLFYLLKLTVQFAEAKLYSLPKQNCTVYQKPVQFTEAKQYSLPKQNCTVY